MAQQTPKVACVAFPMAVAGVFDYEIPEALAGDISPGVPVLVELRSRRLWGVAVRIKDSSAVARLKPVLDVRKDRWRDADASLIKLYEWIASYYQCDLGRVFRPFVRKSFVEAREKTVAVFRVAPGGPPAGLTRKQAEALAALAGRERRAHARAVRGHGRGRPPARGAVRKRRACQERTAGAARGAGAACDAGSAQGAPKVSRC